MDMQRPFLRRAEASAYLTRERGVPVAVATLAKLASTGGGPLITYFGRIPLYKPDDLEAWAAAKLGPPVHSTAEKTE
jgi:hypothetical protein